MTGSNNRSTFQLGWREVGLTQGDAVGRPIRGLNRLRGTDACVNFLACPFPLIGARGDHDRESRSLANVERTTSVNLRWLVGAGMAAAGITALPIAAGVKVASGTASPGMAASPQSRGLGGHRRFGGGHRGA